MTFAGLKILFSVPQSMSNSLRRPEKHAVLTRSPYYLRLEAPFLLILTLS